MAAYDDDDSSDDSLANLHSRVAAIGTTRGKINSESSDDDDDDDSDLEQVDLYASSETQQRAVQAALLRKQQKTIDVLSDGDSDDENYNGAAMRPAQKDVEPKRTSPAGTKRTVYEIDSSDDESYSQKSSSVSLLAQKGVIDESTARKIDMAKQALQRTSKRDESLDTGAQAAFRNLTIAIEGYDAIELSLPESETARDVLNAVLRKLKLPPSTPIGCLRYGERTLADHQLLMELPSVCTLTATILGKIQKTKEKEDIGPILRLQVRHQGVTKRVQMGQKQTLQVLGFAKLRFDGEILDLNQAPSFYDLEDDDLLDVPT